jgi:hypothetical protein
MKLFGTRYTFICSFFCNTDSCQEAANIISHAGDTQAFELMRLAAQEKHERLLEKITKGKHPRQGVH